MMSIKTQVRLALFALTVGATVAQAAEPNDDFASRTVLTPAVRSVADTLQGADAYLWPDTLLRAVDENGNVVAFDDNSSPVGTGYASGLFGVPANADGSIHFHISGQGDFDFDGFVDATGLPHSQEGGIQAALTVYDAAGTPYDDDLVYYYMTPGPPANGYHYIPGLLDPGDTVDFYVINTLEPRGPDPRPAGLLHVHGPAGGVAV